MKTVKLTKKEISGRTEVTVKNYFPKMTENKYEHNFESKNTCKTVFFEKSIYGDVYVFDLTGNSQRIGTAENKKEFCRIVSEYINSK